jgi:DNA-binding HxlR family transcriptional regulator
MEGGHPVPPDSRWYAQICYPTAKIAGVRERMLTQQLRELEHAGIAHREVYPEVRPKFEYSLTNYGQTLRPISKIMCEWGKRHIKRTAAK